LEILLKSNIINLCSEINCFLAIGSSSFVIRYSIFDIYYLSFTFGFWFWH
jgi:hypothetical protein